MIVETTTVKNEGWRTHAMIGTPGNSITLNIEDKFDVRSWYQALVDAGLIKDEQNVNGFVIDCSDLRDCPIIRVNHTPMPASKK